MCNAEMRDNSGGAVSINWIGDSGSERILTPRQQKQNVFSGLRETFTESPTNRLIRLAFYEPSGSTWNRKKKKNAYEAP